MMKMPEPQVVYSKLSSRSFDVRRWFSHNRRRVGLVTVLFGMSLVGGAVACSAGDDGRGEEGSDTMGIDPDASPSEDDDETPKDSDGESDDVPGGETPDFTKPGEDPCGDPDGGDNDEEGDEYDFSIIWVANSEQGTVSKIDTRTAKELARYRTGASSLSDPSRTSVNLAGDVAVLNRTGTLIKISARESTCVDRNRDGEIQTSTGPDDILPWGDDECVLWSHDLGFRPQAGAMNNEGGPRAIAWEIGDEDDPCAREARLWVGWRDIPRNVAMVRRISADGEDFEEVEIPNWTGGEWQHGVYGGATDVDGNFWGISTTGTVIRVDYDTMEVQRWDTPSLTVFYGIAIDGEGALWLTTWENGHLYRFDATKTGAAAFQDLSRDPQSPLYFRGLVVDREFRIWIATHDFASGNGNQRVRCGLTQYNITDKKWEQSLIELPDCEEPVGVSIDAEGFVWVVDRESERAYKVDPKTLRSEVVQGLVKPYTYSDMTGHALHLVEDPPDNPK